MRCPSRLAGPSMSLDGRRRVRTYARLWVWRMIRCLHAEIAIIVRLNRGLQYGSNFVVSSHLKPISVGVVTVDLS